MQTIVLLELEVNCHFSAFLNAARIEPKKDFWLQAKHYK